MRKILSTLVVASLLTATSVAPAFADEEYRMSVFNPLWPIAFALSLPASIIAGVVDPGARVPVILPTVPVPAPVAYSQRAPEGYSQRAPEGYAAPATYYAPGPYYAPTVYYGPSGYYGARANYAPSGYYGPRVNYASRGYYRGNRGYRRVR